MKNTVVVITGASRGLGKAMARLFISKGATVVVSDIDKDLLAATGHELSATAILANVTKEDEVMALRDETVKLFGKIDIWINNAGLWMPPMPLEQTDLEKTKKLFDVNVFGAIYGMRAALTEMKNQGKGTIVNIISTTAFDNMNGSSGSMYVSSKYALRGLTNTVRDEVKETNIKIIGVYPGGIKTDLFNDAVPANIDEFMTPESVAEKIIVNLEKENPELQLIIKRPGQIESKEENYI